MAFQHGTAIGPRDVLYMVDRFITSRHISEVVINAEGTGYAIGDILEVAGGYASSGMAGAIEVLEIDGLGGVIQSRIYNAGAYASDPTITQIVTSETGSGCSVTLTMVAPQWTSKRRDAHPADMATQTRVAVREAQNVPAFDGGTGYAVDDILTFDNSGGLFDTPWKVKVLTVSGSGTVTSFETQQEGVCHYGEERRYYNTYSFTGGTGTGFTASPKFATITDEYWWEGLTTPNGTVFAGMRTNHNVLHDQARIEIAGSSQFDSNAAWFFQPESDSANSTTGWTNSGAREDGFRGILTHHDLYGGNLTFWLSVTERRIVLVVRSVDTYHSLHVGLLEPYGTETHVPFPLYVSGTCSDADVNINSTFNVRSIADPTIDSSTAAGAYYDGDDWHEVYNVSTNGDTALTNTNGYTVFPCNNSSFSQPTGGFCDTDGMTRTSLVVPYKRKSDPSNQNVILPADGGTHIPIQCVVQHIGQGNDNQVIGNIEGVFWVSSGYFLRAGDCVVLDGVAYRVFKMGNNNETFSYFCVRED